MITSFEIKNQRILREATLGSVPRVMMICGPNGVGKTSLVDVIGRESGITTDVPTRISVAPANRTWRKENVLSRMLTSNPTTSLEVFALSVPLSTIASLFGRGSRSSVRDLWSDDESNQFVKPLLAKLKTNYKDHVLRKIEESKYHTPAMDWPDPKSALTKFVDDMFEEISYVDTKEEGENSQLLFTSVNREGIFDIDELSSGEKAIFSIFLPIIEEDFRRQMGEPRREVTLIVDEVENHLHLSLQLRVLDYMRRKLTEGYQFICTTHSTALIQACAQTELFHVLPKGMTVGNQLRKAAKETNELVEVVQQSILFASGYQRHIFCEGFDPLKPDENNICDSELYAELLATTPRERLLSATSKDALTTGLKAACSAVFAPLSLVGIIDGDEGNTADKYAAWCHIVLPVSSLETVLLDAGAITYVLSRYGKTLEEVQRAIENARNKTVEDRGAQLIRPNAYMMPNPDLTLDQLISGLNSGDPTSVFTIRGDALASARKDKERIDQARANPEIAIKNMRGKKIYHYLFQELGLGGLSFTHRSFAMAIIKRIRAENTLSWLTDFENIAKRSMGNALSTLLCTSEGDAIQQHETYGSIFGEVKGMVEPKKFGGMTYALLKEGIRMQDFAEKLAHLSTAVREILPSYKWDA